MCKGYKRPVTYRDVFEYLVNDWLEAELDPEGAAIQRKAAEIGVDELYEKYLSSDALLCSYEQLTDVMRQILESDLK